MTSLDTIRRISKEQSLANAGYLAASNGVTPQDVWQKPGGWCSMMKVEPSVAGMGGKYSTIGGFQTFRLNGFTADATRGQAINLVAGFYKIEIHLSILALDGGVMVEGNFVDEKSRSEIGFIVQSDDLPRMQNISAAGVLFLPANSINSFQLKSSGASGISILRGQFTIGSP